MDKSVPPSKKPELAITCGEQDLRTEVIRRWDNEFLVVVIRDGKHGPNSVIARPIEVLAVTTYHHMSSFGDRGVSFLCSTWFRN